METTAEELEALRGMTTGELCQRYQELFGQPVRTRHKAYLVRKLAWRIQAVAEGGLSERARRRAAELADDADVRVMPPKAATSAAGGRGDGGSQVVPVPATAPADRRLPPPGSALVRQYKGRRIEVAVRADGFEYDGTRYKTLTAVAEQVTGSHVNGYRFFKLEARP